MRTLKYSVISRFIDKNTQVYHPEGSVFETKSKERANELQSGGFLGEEIKAALKQKSPAKQGEKDESSEV